MRKIDIYIDVRHLDYWWGIYGFCKKTSWEDMILYRKWGKGYRKLAWTCICTRPYFKSGLEDLKNDPDEKDFVEKIVEFLDRDEISYHYCYDKLEDKDFYEVPYEAQRNEYNVKPRYVETWYPSDGVDEEVIDNCARTFCKKFLGIEAGRVEFKEVVPVKDALDSYLEHIRIWQQNPNIIFSDSLVEQLQNEWNASKEKVMEVLNRSIK